MSANSIVANNALGITLLRLLEKEGVSGEQLAANSSLPLSAFQGTGLDIPIGEFETLLALAIDLSGRHDLILRFGQEISVSALGVLGYAFMCCDNISECMEIFLRYQRLLSPEIHVDEEIEGDHVSIVLQKGFWGKNVGLMDTELLFSGAAAILRSLCGNKAMPLKVFFSHSKPKHVDAYHQVFGRNVVFGAARNRLEMDASFLEKQLVFADPTMKQVYQQQCDQMLALLDNGKYTSQVQQLLLSKPGYFPNIDNSAEHLCIGVRTLRRRLVAEGTSYKQIVQNVRCQLAEEYLRDSPLSITEIADMLGYGDVANFRRAFISWTNLSPAQYRKQRQS